MILFPIYDLYVVFTIFKGRIDLFSESFFLPRKKKNPTEHLLCKGEIHKRRAKLQLLNSIASNYTLWPQHQFHMIVSKEREIILYAEMMTYNPSFAIICESLSFLHYVLLQLYTITTAMFCSLTFCLLLVFVAGIVYYVGSWSSNSLFTVSVFAEAPRGESCKGMAR